VNHLLGVWLSGSEEESRAVRGRLDEKIDSYAAGGMEHAVDAMSSILEISNKEGPVPSGPAPRPPSFSWFWSPCAKPKEGIVRTSLVKSIQEGYLLDRKYWTKRSREGVIEPIYFSSTVAQAELLGLDMRESPRPQSCQGAELRSVGMPPGL
jgi:hypothetical protein